MDTATLIDNIVPISTFNQGGASKAFARVSDGSPVIVLKNNKPSAIIISPEDFKKYDEAMEDLGLLQLAQERLSGSHHGLLDPSDVWGENYTPVDAGYEADFE